MSTYIEQLRNIRRNPLLMFQYVMDDLYNQLNGKGDYEVPDPNLPFVNVTENNVLQTAMFVNEFEAGMRKLYPRNANTSEDLYLHMSYNDYIGRFATPGSTVFTQWFNYDEIISKAVPEGDYGVKRLTIPRLTQFTGAGIPFTMQYPINIRVQRHGGLLIEYDTSEKSPIKTLETNVPKWDITTISGQKLLYINIDVDQFQVNTYTETINPSQLYQNKFQFTNAYYYARVYLSDGANWKEIQTTHTDQVYDPMEVTAVLKVYNNTLEIYIPSIYMTTGLATGDIRVDIYTTMGAIDRDLGNYQDNQFEVVYNSIDDDTKYTAPLNTLQLNQVLSYVAVTRGTNAIPFSTFREAVINNNTGPIDIPIVNTQLTYKLQERGFNVVSNIDQITKRQFLATKRLETPTTISISSGASTYMGALTLSVEQIIKSKYVKDNGSRITLLPDNLYSLNNGVTSILLDSEIDQLRGLDPESKARVVNDNKYSYSPFHYVLDLTNNSFDSRPYYLDNPVIKQKQFIGENDTALLQANVSAFNITKQSYGYQITVKLTSDTAFKEIADENIYLQIGYIPVDEIQYASVNGQLIGTEDNERVYIFDIRTNYDIDADGNLYTTNMSMFDLVQTEFSTPLDLNLDISICVGNLITPGYQRNELDDLVQTHLLPSKYMVVTRERFTVTLGYDMSSIWHRNRTVIGPESYKRYTENVYLTYDKNIYATDANGAIIIDINPDGTLSYEILHRQGDTVLDDNGQPVIKYSIGDIILENGQPVLNEPRKLMREITLFLVEGIFYFANEISAATYAKQIPMELVNWVQTDIEYIKKRLLEDCSIYVYPTNTYGQVMVTVKDGLKYSISVDQSLTVNYYLTDTAYRNRSIRPALIPSTKTVLNSILGNNTISKTDMITALKQVGGDDVLDVNVIGIGGDQDFQILTVDDQAYRLNIHKKLVVMANQELTVEDDIVILFNKHSLS